MVKLSRPAAAPVEKQALKASIMECMSSNNQFQDLRNLVRAQEQMSKESDGLQTNIES